MTERKTNKKMDSEEQLKAALYLAFPTGDAVSFLLATMSSLLHNDDGTVNLRGMQTLVEELEGGSTPRESLEKIDTFFTMPFPFPPVLVNAMKKSAPAITKSMQQLCENCTSLNKDCNGIFTEEDILKSIMGATLRLGLLQLLDLMQNEIRSSKQVKMTTGEKLFETYGKPSKNLH